MAVDRQAAARTKLAVDRVGGPDGDREEPVVPERAMPGDGGLDQVADAIELVTPRQILVFVAGLHDLDVGVEVAVRALRRRHEVDRPVGIAGQGRVRSPPELPGGRLQPLVEVGVEEREDDADLLAEGAIATVGPCRQAEVRQVPGVVRVADSRAGSSHRGSCADAGPRTRRSLPTFGPPRGVRAEIADAVGTTTAARRLGLDRHGPGTRRPTLRHFTAPLVRPDT